MSKHTYIYLSLGRAIAEPVWYNSFTCTFGILADLLFIKSNNDTAT